MSFNLGENLRHVLGVLVVLILVGIVVTFSYPQKDTEAPTLSPSPTQSRESSWPPTLRGDAVEKSVSVKGVKPVDRLRWADLEKDLGEPTHYSQSLSGAGGEALAYPGHIIVETHGSNGTVDTIYSAEILVDENLLNLNTSEERLSELLGPPHATLGDLCFYRIKGNYRLLVCFEGGEKVRYFALFNGVGGRQKFGWPEGTTGPWPGTEEDPFPYPFQLQPTD